MSQHDYVLENQSGANFRQDANNALAAIVTNNSGTTEPAATFAGMWWIDTTSSWVKQRNSVNTAWIKKFPMGDSSRVDVASAATIDLTTNAVVSDYIRITGTTTITSVVLENGQKKVAVLDGVLTLTNGASLLLPNGTNLISAAGDVILLAGEASGVVRVVLLSSADIQDASTTVKGIVELATSTEVITGTDTARAVTPAGLAATRRLAQIVTYQTGSVATGSTTIPLDDTIPQNTEGDQYMSLAITPTNASSTLEIDIEFFGAVNTQADIIVALFKDTDVSALVAGISQVYAGAARAEVSIKHIRLSGSTSTSTFKVRAGSPVAGILTFNGAGGTGLFGGVMGSRITIKEYLP